MNVSFAGFSWRVEPGADARELLTWLAPYEMGTATSDAWHVEVTLDARGTADAGTDLQVERLSATCYVARRLDFEVRVDLEAKTAWMHVEHAPTAVASALRVTTALALAASGGLLVHASGVVERGRAFVFVGPSGTGKTTLARLSAPRTVLSDEAVALLPDARGGFTAHATPFWGDLGLDSGIREASLRAERAAPIDTLVFPLQASSASVEPISGASAVRRLLHCTFLFGADEELAERVLTTCTTLVHVVRPRALRFGLDAAFWRVIS